MTFGGWICMIFAISTVTGAFGWCCWKVVSTPQNGDLTAASEYVLEDPIANRRKKRRERRLRRNRMPEKNRKGS